MKRKANVILDPFEKPDFTQEGVSLTKGFAYYNYKYTVKDAQKWVAEWAKSKKMDRNTMKAIAQYDFTMTIGSLCKMLIEGYPEDSNLTDKIMFAINKAKESYVPPKPKKKVALGPTKSIQELMHEKVLDFMGEHIEGEIDEMRTNKGKSTFKLLSLLEKHDVPAKHVGIMSGIYAKELKEFEVLLTGKDEYVNESYPYKKAEIKRIHKFFTNLVNDANHYIDKKKATRKTRTKKAPDMEKIMAKVQYQKECKEFRLVSDDPSTIIGAKEIWLYNTKYKKLIRAFAEDADMGGVFSIKGTTIQGVGKSEMKTLRKPKETLAAFKKAGKVKLRKFMDDIKTKATPFTGRLNKDIVILKVTK